MQRIAERYVRLVLAVGQHDAAYVDAYYGPEAWQREAAECRVPLEALATEASQLTAELAEVCGAVEDSDDRAHRCRFLSSQLSAVRTRIEMLAGRHLAFDEESFALYGAVAPTHSESHFEEILDQLEGLLPGGGLLVERLDRFRESFIIPTGRLASVSKPRSRRAEA